jgi:flagellar motor protein MotB
MTRTIGSRLSRGLMLAGVALAALVAGGCNNAEKEQVAKLSEENASLRQSLDTRSQELAASEARRAEAENQAASLKLQMDNRTATPPSTPGSGSRDNPGRESYVLAGDVSFASGQAELTAAGRRELDSISSRIKRDHPGSNLLIEGFTDRHPIRKSRWGTNEALSAARAEAVKRHLTTKGIAASRIDTVGRGATNLKSTDAASRRVEIKVLN